LRLGSEVGVADDDVEGLPGPGVGVKDDVTTVVTVLWVRSVDSEVCVGGVVGVVGGDGPVLLSSVGVGSGVLVVDVVGGGSSEVVVGGVGSGSGSVVVGAGSGGVVGSAGGLVSGRSVSGGLVPGALVGSDVSTPPSPVPVVFAMRKVWRFSRGKFLYGIGMSTTEYGMIKWVAMRQRREREGIMRL
jgi:hypothetical protein